MRDECAGDLSLEVVARRIAISPRQLQRAFEEADARPFQEVLVAVRLARAAERLRESDVAAGSLDSRSQAPGASEVF